MVFNTKDLRLETQWQHVGRVFLDSLNFFFISKEFCIYNKTLITVKMSGRPKYKVKTYYVGISQMQYNIAWSPFSTYLPKIFLMPLVLLVCKEGEGEGCGVQHRPSLSDTVSFITIDSVSAANEYKLTKLIHFTLLNKT